MAAEQLAAIRQIIGLSGSVIHEVRVARVRENERRPFLPLRFAAREERLGESRRASQGERSGACLRCLRERIDSRHLCHRGRARRAGARECCVRHQPRERQKAHCRRHEDRSRQRPAEQDRRQVSPDVAPAGCAATAERPETAQERVVFSSPYSPHLPPSDHGSQRGRRHSAARWFVLARRHTTFARRRPGLRSGLQ